MTQLETLLAEIKERVEAATPLPYKFFPVVVVGDGESHRLMNEYTALGMRYCTDIPALLAVIEKLIEQRNDNLSYADNLLLQHQKRIQEKQNNELAHLIEERRK